MLDGYREQRGAILEHAEKLVDSFVARNESIVIEGVHLSGEFAITMMKRHASVVPFLVHISNRDKHMERFAVRAKSMTLRPDSNRYVKHLESIRSIQEALRGEASKYLIPQVDNTNVDRSLAVIHSTVLGALRVRVSHGKALTNGDTCMPVLDIFNAAIKSSWSSRAILRKIQGDKSTFDLSGPSPATSVTSTTLGTGALSGLSDHVLKDAFQNLRVDEYESGSQGSAPDHHDGSVLETLSEHTKSDDGHAL
jgi:2-phosphoglycerate kinase